jgi:hypothetical protein
MAEPASPQRSRVPQRCDHRTRLVPASHARHVMRMMDSRTYPSPVRWPLRSSGSGWGRGLTARVGARAARTRRSSAGSS